MKTTVKNAVLCILKLLLFAYLFMSIYNYTKEVFTDKYASESLNIITEQRNGTYDVILAGSSHMQYAIQPAQLFGEYGISACNVSTASQSIPTTYYIVKEMIRRHDPELVVVDLFLIYHPELYQAGARLHQAFDAFPISLNKIAAIEDLLDEGKTEYYLNYLLYHERWKNLSEYDFQFRNYFNEKYQLLTGGESFENDFTPIPVTDTAEIPPVPLKYLKKIVDLCKETNTPLLLTVVPYRADVVHADTPILIQQRMYNTVAAYAEEWDVDYLNSLHVLNEMGFDFQTDLYEYSHLNTSGSRKTSAYYGALFKKNYQIPDRSQDPAYADWYEDYDEYLKRIQ